VADDHGRLHGGNLVTVGLQGWGGVGTSRRFEEFGT